MFGQLSMICLNMLESLRGIGILDILGAISHSALTNTVYENYRVIELIERIVN